MRVERTRIASLAREPLLLQERGKFSFRHAAELSLIVAESVEVRVDPRGLGRPAEGNNTGDFLQGLRQKGGVLLLTLDRFIDLLKQDRQDRRLQVRESVVSTQEDMLPMVSIR